MPITTQRLSLLGALVASAGALCFLAFCTLRPHVEIDFPHPIQSSPNPAGNQAIQRISAQPIHRDPNSGGADVAIAGEPGQVRADPPIHDPALRHIRDVIENMLTPEGRRAREERLEINGSSFQDRYNPSRRQLTADQTSSLQRIVQELNARVTDAYVAALVEEYVAAQALIESGTYRVLPSTEKLRPASLGSATEPSRVLILPGTDVSTNRIVTLTPTSHPKLFRILDSVSDLTRRRDSAIEAFFQ